jgi:hypothetical protein
MTEIRQCWAYKWGTNERCDMPGGHPGNHSTSVVWNDLDCASPSDLTTIPLIIGTPEGQPEPPVTHIAVAPPAPTKCVACTHHHKSGICKCGCHEHIG